MVAVMAASLVAEMVALTAAHSAERSVALLGVSVVETMVVAMAVR